MGEFALRWPVVKEPKLLRALERCLTHAIFRAQRAQAKRLVLCVSELTLLPVVVPAIGAGADLNAKLARGLRETLEALGDFNFKDE